MTLALLLNKKSPDKIQERRNNFSQNKKEEQERSQEKSTEQKPTKEAQEKKAQHNNQITVSDEKFISIKENAHLRPTKVQDKAAHFYKASSPFQGLDCTLS